ncbi:MAG: hypothetical protein JRH15_15415 [Deltaproteobacteria bacterium]|nr:hypothetical protein [Deltaproteobacteria bacterium]
MKKEYNTTVAFFFVFLGFMCCFDAGQGFAADDWLSVGEKSLVAYPEDPEIVARGIERAQAAGVSAHEVMAILSRSAGATVSAGDFAELVNRMTLIRQGDLPLQPFTDKIMEGLAKKVPPPLILSVLDTKMAVYRDANELVSKVIKKAGGDRALPAVAMAVERGVSVDGFRTLYASGKKSADVVFHSAHAVADLYGMGFSESQSIRIAGAGMAAGYFRTDHSRLVQMTARAKKSGRSHEEIANTLASGLRKGNSMSDIGRNLYGPRGVGNGGGGFGGSIGHGSGGKGAGGRR